MARAMVKHYVKDQAGRVIQNASVTIRAQGSGTALTDSYNAETGGSLASTLTSNAQGEVVFWLDSYRDLVDLYVTDNGGTALLPATNQTLTFTAFTETVPVPARVDAFVRTVGATFTGDVFFKSGRPWVDVRAYGAVGDGVADDTAAIQAAIDACLDQPTSDPATTTRIARAVLYLPGGLYKVTSPLKFYSIMGFHMIGEGYGTRLVVNGITAAAVLDINGVSYGTFEHFLIQGTDTESITSAVKVDWTTASQKSTSGVTFNKITIQNVKYVNGFAFGVDSPSRQVDNITLLECLVIGGWTAGNTTTYQNGVLIGNGTNGNVLNYDVLSTSVGRNRYNVHVRAVSTVNWIGGDCGSAEFDVFWENNGGTFYMEGQRSEGSTRLFATGTSGSAPSSVKIDQVLFSINAINADMRVITFEHAGALMVDGLRFAGLSTQTPHIYVATQVKVTVVCNGCASNLPPQSFVQGATANRLNVLNIGYEQLSSGALSSGILHGVYIAQPLADGASGITFGTNTTADTNLYRSAVDTLKTDDRFVAAGGIDTRVVATASLPAAGAAMNGHVLIEDVGAGDRNLIIYAGDQRFRIDGGAAF